MRLLYDIFLRLYNLGIWLASPVNSKAKKWIFGRKQSFKQLEHFVQLHPKNIWIHCASVGEFEQGLPIIQRLESEYVDYKILISFFSPSGYDFVAKKYPNLAIVYLPLDTKKNAKKWLNILNPKAAFFVKYEFWHHYFSELHNSNTPLFMVSAVFWKDLFFFKSYGKFFQIALKKVTHFFLQDNESKELLASIGIENTTVTGDARFERVLELKNQELKDERIEEFINDNDNILIVGSAWDADIPIIKKIIESIPDNFKILIAPHQVDHFSYDKFSKLKTEKYTDESFGNSRILFLNTLGILSKVYRYAKFVYIGGGFGKGIHNVLEPAVYNKPVIIGPNCKQFLEVKQLSEIGLVHIVENENSLERIIPHVLNTKADIIRLNKIFFAKNANVSEQIIVFIKKHAFLD